MPAGSREPSRLELVAGYYSGDDRDDMVVMYTEDGGGTAANTFEGLVGGGFPNHLESWQAPAGIFRSGGRRCRQYGARSPRPGPGGGFVVRCREVSP
ncbi:hypothetical protein ACFWUW_26140 [Streptomyces sp. NPDC058655]|uniref:hypothetical protein n=1 Tax=Streptomyces sp. NPDC058655 TaxID=3346577 RepID=UPI00366A4DD6